MVYILGKTIEIEYFKIKFDEVIIFQKPPIIQEKVILSVLDHLDK